MNVLMTRHSALRTIILPSGKQQIEPIEHFRPFQLLVHDNDVKGDASVLFSGTMSGSCVNRKSIDKVLGYPHPAKEDLYVFATHDGSDTKLVGTSGATAAFVVYVTVGLGSDQPLELYASMENV